jgi:3-hydroxyacyl-CoA dehydrogenase
MDLERRLRNVTVVGAAGKMGSGIALLLLREMAWLRLEERSEPPVLNLVDVSDEGLRGLVHYLRAQITKDAEKQISRLRRAYRERADLVENGEMIQDFANEALLLVRTGKTTALAVESSLVFEAVVESEQVKAALLRELRGICPEDAYFFTNTSSIPIHVLEEASGLDGRLVGAHFYNPPAVQALLELITPSGCQGELQIVSRELARRLGKTVVPSRDVAGFIGNGHFIRDGLHAIREAERLSQTRGLPAAIALMDVVTRDWLLRPMGIFQLIDYVGVDVFALILTVMTRHLEERLESPFIGRLRALGVTGGQTSSGTQRDGILRYDKGRPSGVFDVEAGRYRDLEPGWRESLGTPPVLSWKALQTDPARDTHLRDHFRRLASTTSLGAELAVRHARESRRIALQLVEQGVAERSEDVKAVLELGFFHLYDPAAEFIP